MPIDKIQQEEMNKRFDEKFPGVSCECGDRDIFDFEPVKSFLQSEINLAVANREKEIVEIIRKENYEKVGQETTPEKHFTQ